MNEQKQKTVVIIHPFPAVLYGFNRFLQSGLSYKPGLFNFELCQKPEEGIAKVRQEGVYLVITNEGEGTNDEPRHGIQTLREIRKTGYIGLALMMTNRGDVSTLDKILREENLALGTLSSGQAHIHEEPFVDGIRELLEGGYSRTFEPLYGKTNWEGFV